MIESHPGVPLIVHLKAVANNCLNVAKNNTTDFGYSQNTKEIITYICGVFHDLGKGTSYFQEYLKNPKGEHSSLKNHALPSAVFVFYVVKQFAELLSPLEKQNSFFLAAICFAVVKRHHGHLKDFKNEFYLEDKKEDLKKQYKAMCPLFTQKLVDECLSKCKLNIQWGDFILWFDSEGFDQVVNFDYLDFELSQFNKWKDEQKSSAYYFFLWMFSTLLYSDKSDVILGGSFPKIPMPDIAFLEQYRKKKGYETAITKLDQLKNEAYFSVLNQLEKEFNPQQRLYSITLPTGLGKTLTSLGTALKLISLAKLKNGRIITAIPFTSIIDQNFQIFEEVFINPDTTLLLKHHHLSELRYKEGEDSVRNEDESQHLIETWQSAVVVTTFVQLLECLITNNKSKLLKFSSLSNSVILLDEVQQIPHHLWQVIRSTFFTIAEHLNCYIVLMSATQPLIFHPREEIQELVPDYKKYFSFFNRTKLINRIGQVVQIDTFIDDVSAYAEEYPEKDILIILNTKKDTLTCFRELRDRLPENNELRYLTTLITPHERKSIINEIRNRSSESRYVIVSTQLIEAGVDISMDTVFRALAPLDSIIQAAGRVNRYNEKQIGEVYLYKIEEQYNSSCILYGKDLMLKTELVLGNTKIIEEKDFLPLIANYFEQVKDLASHSDKKLLKDLLSLNFEGTGKFKLIEERDCESIFVVLNDEANNVWKEFVSINENLGLSSFDKRKAFSKIKSKFYDYVINAPIPYDKKSLELPLNSIYGFYLWEFQNPDHNIYCYGGENSRDNEGFVFNGISAISF